ncbi:unnamed protein product [Lactuca virosa]|uniref:Uncharacterized protein n=1 Tax=Lactuca virosa TaxID=75947 RepID=A0AAU9PMB9_9ASTR|nr:unnamed protein product [Lactuca virosa]
MSSDRQDTSGFQTPNTVDEFHRQLPSSTTGDNLPDSTTLHLPHTPVSMAPAIETNESESPISASLGGAIFSTPSTSFDGAACGNHHHREYPQPSSPNSTSHQFIRQSRSANNHHNTSQSLGATNKKQPTSPVTFRSRTPSPEKQAAAAWSLFLTPRIKNFATRVFHHP